MGLAKGDPQQRNGPPIQLPLTLVLDRNLEASSRPQGLRHPWTTAPGRFICPRDAVSALVGERVEDRYLACQLLDLSRPPTIWGVRRSFGCWLGVIIALSLVLPTSAVASPPNRRSSRPIGAQWAKFHFDNRNSNFNPLETIVGPSNVSQLTARWSFKTGMAVRSSPAVVGGTLYGGSDDGEL